MRSTEQRKTAKTSRRYSSESEPRSRSGRKAQEAKAIRNAEYIQIKTRNWVVNCKYDKPTSFWINRCFKNAS